jgi:Fe-S-cluster-containing dehydrogenase component
MMTLTGMNADDRIQIKPSQQFDVACALLYEIGVLKAKTISGALAQSLAQFKTVPGKIGIETKLWNSIVEELWLNRGHSLVVAGGMSTMTSDHQQLLMAVNSLNSALGNDGQTVDCQSAVSDKISALDVQQLVADLEAGKIKTLIIHGANPAFSLPDAVEFGELMAKAEMVISTSSFMDETSLLSHYVLPAGSSLENWGDVLPRKGLFAIQQPTIRPMYDSRSFEDTLLVWTKAGGSKDAVVAKSTGFYEYLYTTWEKSVFPQAKKSAESFADFWARVLQVGFVAEASFEKQSASGSASRPAKTDLFKPEADRRKKTDGFELAAYTSVQMGDGFSAGNLANVPWLHELPDPVTKAVWDNYVCVSAETAKKHDLIEGNVIEISNGEVSVEAPVVIQPGIHNDILAIAVGYGRRASGRVADKIGVDAGELAIVDQGNFIYSGMPVTFKKTGRFYEIARTQDHHSMEGRQIVVETTNKAYQKDAGAGIHRHKIFSIWPSHQYTKHKWGMSIDLNSCTGCSACVIACQSENNIPVVGKKYVMQGREMHWIRIDRYYKGDPSAPEAVFQPMTCQQCENAPCETVCPVQATVHSDEGLNDMVYNRCVGTRYCSNNCPYKVRRFNWFNYSNREQPLHMALNPDVTVRPRGVMEKCTFCVQRIRHGTNAARDRKEKLQDGEIKTACQQSCPADAIVFGDLNDPESRVRKMQEEARSYTVLEELNAAPRVRYLSRVRNADRAEVSHGAHASAATATEPTAPQNHGEHR